MILVYESLLFGSKDQLFQRGSEAHGIDPHLEWRIPRALPFPCHGCDCPVATLPGLTPESVAPAASWNGYGTAYASATPQTTSPLSPPLELLLPRPTNDCGQFFTAVELAAVAEAQANASQTGPGIWQAISQAFAALHVQSETWAHYIRMQP